MEKINRLESLNLSVPNYSIKTFSTDKSLFDLSSNEGSVMAKVRH